MVMVVTTGVVVITDPRVEGEERICCVSFFASPFCVVPLVSLVEGDLAGKRPPVVEISDWSPLSFLQGADCRAGWSGSRSYVVDSSVWGGSA